MSGVRILASGEFAAAIPRLADILIDAVESGAGVSFMAPLSRDGALAYWRGVDPAAVAVFVAERDGEIAGTVQLHRCWPPNQPHRCEVAKMLVHRAHRRKGIGTALMAALEAEAKARGYTLITFDAVTGGAAEKLYVSLGFVPAGVIPGYALSPHGKLDATTVFYKAI